MIKVNNKDTLKKLSHSIYQQNQMRNLFAVIAIILTTVLFCALFTIVASMKSSIEESTMRQVGGSAHGGFKYLSSKEYDTLSVHPLIREISYSVVLGYAENEALLKRPTEIRYANDEAEAKMMFALPEAGRMPQAKGELATDTLVLEKLKVPAKLGERVTLQYSVGESHYTETFTLVGYWTGDVLTSASQVWLAREYVNEVLEKHGLSERQMGTAHSFDEVVGTIQADVNFANSRNIEKKLQRVITESGYSLDEIAYGVNWAYAGGNVFGVKVLLGVCGIALAIVFCGYLMIANVFLISIQSDIRFYGLLRTIGTTGAQLRQLLQRQALLLAALGIPVGLLLGLLTGRVLTPVLLALMNTNVIKTAFSPLILVFSTGFSLVTVLVSMEKAARQAAKVSPMEAIHTNEAYHSKKSARRGNRVRLWKMACANVGRNKKRVVFVVLSLSLSLIILNAAFAMADSFDVEEYLSDFIRHDFVMGDVSWFNVYANYASQDTVSEAFLRELWEMPGIEAHGNVYFGERSIQPDERWKELPAVVEETFQESGTWLQHMKEEYATGWINCHVYGLDDSIWQELELFEGSIDLEKLRSGKYAVVSAYDDRGILRLYHVGDTVQVVNREGNDESKYSVKNYEVLAVANIPYAISARHSHPMELEVFLPSDIFLRDMERKAPMITTLDVTDEAAPAFEAFLQDYSEHRDGSMQYKSRGAYMAECENTKRTYRLVGMAACFLLASIGIANFANTVLTSLVTRKRELALLRAVGMTVSQQRKMLVLEGIMYLFLALGVVATAGNLFVSTGLNMALGTDGYFKVRPTVLPSLLCFPVFLLLTIIIPALGQHFMCKKTVVDRLREIE